MCCIVSYYVFLCCCFYPRLGGSSIFDLYRQGMFTVVLGDSFRVCSTKDDHLEKRQSPPVFITDHIENAQNA